MVRKIECSDLNESSLRISLAMKKISRADVKYSKRYNYVVSSSETIQSVPSDDASAVDSSLVKAQFTPGKKEDGDGGGGKAMVIEGRERGRGGGVNGGGGTVGGREGEEESASGHMGNESSSPVDNTSVDEAVIIILIACPGADGLKENKWKVPRKTTFAQLELRLGDKLKEAPKFRGSLYLYCKSGFSPTPDQTVNDMYDHFQQGGRLVVHYGYQERFG